MSNNLEEILTNKFQQNSQNQVPQDIDIQAVVENKTKDNFDPQQRAVLDSISAKQLVSAGAGSGKTTVMIQKIVDILLNGQAGTDEILVVTFTNLAATEMRERLVKKLTTAFNKSQTEEPLPLLVCGCQRVTLSLWSQVNSLNGERAGV